MKKLLFLFNPHAGKAQIKNKLLQIVDIMVKGPIMYVKYVVMFMRETQHRPDAGKRRRVSYGIRPRSRI